MDKDLQALLNICSAFGIYTLQKPRLCGKNVGNLFKVYIILLIMYIFFFGIWGIIESPVYKEYIISWVVSTIVFSSQMLTYFIILCEALTKHRAHTDFLQLLQQIEISFKLHLKMDIGKLQIISEVRKTFLVLTLISKLGLIVMGLNFIIYAYPVYIWWGLVAILAIRFRFIQLIVYVEILKSFTLCLNQKLKQVVCLKMEKSKQLLDIDYKHLQSLEILKIIKDIYSSIYEASLNLNEFAQFSLFAACATNFLDCTCHIYWSLLALDNFLSSSILVSSAATIIPLSWLIFHFCHCCHILKRESHLTSLLVSRLMCNSPCLMVHKTYKNFVHDFCLQLCHQRMEITGKRFFIFDLECIFAIFVLIITHLIIIIQFTKSDLRQYEMSMNQTFVEENN